MIPMMKYAESDDGFIDSAVKEIWNTDAGPLENLFNLIENLGIIFGGGWGSLVLIGLKVMGIDGAALGRFLDHQLQLKTLDDLAQHSPEDLAEHATKFADQGSAQGAADDADEADFGPPVRTGAWEEAVLKKTAYGLRGRGLFGATKQGLLSKVFGPMFKWLLGDAKLSRALRAAGIVGAAHFHDLFSGDHYERYKTQNGGGLFGEPTKKTPQEQLEAAVDHILEEE